MFYIKVALAIRVSGNELSYLSVNNVQDKGSYILIFDKVRYETNISRSSRIVEGFSLNGPEICRKYVFTN